MSSTERTPLTEEALIEMGYLDARKLPDGTFAVVSDMTYGKGRLSLDADEYGINGNAYCYTSFIEAIAALHSYDPATMKEPEGWVRSVRDGRRRPDKTIKSEYINP